MRGLNAVAASAIVGLCVGVAAGDTVTIGAIKDNTLYQDAAGALSNGVGAALFAGQSGQGLTRRGLLAFDIAGSVPAGSTITGVTLRLNLSQSNAGTADVGLHRVLANWGEGTSSAGSGGGGSGAAATVGDATWLHTFFNTSFWANAGGDFSPGASAVTTVGATGSYLWSSPGMIADVQSWLDSPAASFGWLLKGNEVGSGTARRFDSREAALINRPSLLIEYTVPAPSGVALGAGAVVLAARRRRVA